MKMTSMVEKFVSVMIVVVLLSGCSKSKDVKTIQGDPEVLYKDGLTLFNKQNYGDALKKFEELKTSFPDSPPYTTWAELKVGDCHFLDESYVEAIAAYEEFKKTHPTHEEIPYVQYQIGMSYFNQMTTLDRDQTSTRKALSSFEYLVANFSPSLFTEKAKDRIVACRKRLADHEFYIGDYYYKKGNYPAAVARFEGLLEQFPKIEQEDRTYFFLGKSYVEMNQRDLARAAFTRLVTEYPKSVHAREASAILDRDTLGKAPAPTRSADRITQDTSAKTERVDVVLLRFEDEVRKPLSFSEERKAPLEKTEVKEKAPSIVPESTALAPLKPSLEIEKADVAKVPAVTEAPSSTSHGAPSSGSVRPGAPAVQRVETGVAPQEIDNPRASLGPAEEGRKSAPPAPASKSEPTSPAEKQLSSAALPAMQKPALSPTSSTPRRKEGPLQGLGAIGSFGTEKAVDGDQPVDISSERVESYLRDNRILFKGNVTVRHKDVVIYADSIEALTVENGKNIEKVIADGNVRVQQGLRSADCQRAIFYNFERKVVLTGNPRLLEGSNQVSGEEIVFDIEQNRVDVKGGPGGRGKAKIQP